MATTSETAIQSNNTSTNTIEEEIVEFSPGEVVWARVKGFPYWPARIMPDDCAIGVKGLHPPADMANNVLVCFFRTENYAFCPVSQLKHYRSAGAEKLRSDRKETNRRVKSQKKVAIALADEYLSDLEEKLFGYHEQNGYAPPAAEIVDPTVVESGPSATTNTAVFPPTVTKSAAAENTNTVFNAVENGLEAEAPTTAGDTEDEITSDGRGTMDANSANFLLAPQTPTVPAVIAQRAQSSVGSPASKRARFTSPDVLKPVVKAVTNSNSVVALANGAIPPRPIVTIDTDGDDVAAETGTEIGDRDGGGRHGEAGADSPSSTAPGPSRRRRNNNSKSNASSSSGRRNSTINRNRRRGGDVCGGGTSAPVAIVSATSSSTVAMMNRLSSPPMQRDVDAQLTYGFVFLGASAHEDMIDAVMQKHSCHVFAGMTDGESLRDMQTVQSIPELIAKCDVIISYMPSTKEYLGEVVFSKQGILQNLLPGKLYIEMSNLSPAQVTRINEEVVKKNARFMEAPFVDLGTHHDLEKRFVFMCGGEKEMYLRVERFLHRMLAMHVFFLGYVGVAARMKVVLQHFQAVFTAATAEGLALAEGLGLPKEATLDMLAWSRMDSLLSRTGTMIVQEQFDVDVHRLDNVQSDVQRVVEVAGQANVPVFLAAQANEMYKLARRDGLDRNDHSAVYLALSTTSSK